MFVFCVYLGRFIEVENIFWQLKTSSRGIHHERRKYSGAATDPRTQQPDDDDALCAPGTGPSAGSKKPEPATVYQPIDNKCNSVDYLLTGLKQKRDMLRITRCFLVGRAGLEPATKGL